MSDLKRKIFYFAEIDIEAATRIRDKSYPENHVSVAIRGCVDFVARLWVDQDFSLQSKGENSVEAKIRESCQELRQGKNQFRNQGKTPIQLTRRNLHVSESDRERMKIIQDAWNLANLSEATRFAIRIRAHRMRLYKLDEITQVKRFVEQATEGKTS